LAGEPLPPGALPVARERALLLIADLWARGLTADTLVALRGPARAIGIGTGAIVGGDRNGTWAESTNIASEEPVP